MKEDPGVFAGAERNICQKIDKAVSVRLSSLRPPSEAGQPAQFLIQKDNIPFVVDIVGQVGQNGPEHGDEKSGQQVLPEQVVVAWFAAVLLPGIHRLILPLLAQCPTSFRNDVGFVRTSIAKARAVPVERIDWKFRIKAIATCGFGPFLCTLHLRAFMIQSYIMDKV